MARGDETELALTATALADLHNLDMTNRPGSEQLPRSRWLELMRPEGLLSELHAFADRIPPELESRYAFCIDTLNNVRGWPEVPMTLLHSDCNPDNAVRTSRNRVTLIDWDGAGVGPAVVDLAYLIFHCHLRQPSWPVIEPNAAWIAAIVRAYGERRPFVGPELRCLREAIALVECHALARSLPGAVRGDWSNDRGFTRFLGREKRVGEIAAQCMAACQSSGWL